MVYEIDDEIVYCVDPLTGAQKVLNKENLENANNTTFAKLDNQNQEAIKKIVKVTNERYNETKDSQYLVAGQMLVWEQSGAKIEKTSASVNDKMNEIEEDLDQSTTLSYYDTIGQDLVGEEGTTDSNNSDTLDPVEPTDPQEPIVPEEEINLMINYQEDEVKSIKENSIQIKVQKEGQEEVMGYNQIQNII